MRVLGSAAFLSFAAAWAAPSPAGTTTGSSARPVTVGARVVPITSANAQRVQKRWEAATNSWGHAVAVHRGIGRVAASTGSSTTIFELRDGSTVGSLAPSCSVVAHGLGFGDGKLAVVCEHELALFDARSLAKVQSINVDADEVKAAAVLWPRAALAHDDGVIRVYRLDGGPTIEIPVPGPPLEVKSLAISKDGAKIAVAWVQGSLWWWETARPAAFHALDRYSTQINAMRFDDGGRKLASEGASFETNVWSFQSPQPIKQSNVRTGSWVNGLRFTKDGRWLAVGGSDGLHLSEVGGTQRVDLDRGASIEDVDMDEQGSVIVTTDRSGVVRCWTAG